MRLNILLAAAAATLVAATPAVAQQTSKTAEARGTVLSPLTLTKVTDLDFGTVAAGTALGTVSVNANTGIRSFTTGVGQPTPVPSTVTRGEFKGLAQEATTVQLTLVPPTGGQIYSGTDFINVRNMTLDSGGATRVVPAGGSFVVGVGADFDIAANQANGTYSGLFEVFADYQ